MALDYSKISLGQLSGAIERNLAQAKKLQLRIGYHFEGKKLVGVMRTKFNFVCYEKKYEGEFLHLMIARMHDDFRHVLETEQLTRRYRIIKAWNERRAQRKENADAAAEEKRVYNIRRESFLKHGTNSPFPHADFIDSAPEDYPQ
jgi:hypothetical protein